jgi:dCTP deaminase
MVLTGTEIKKQIEEKRIHISPFSDVQLNPNSYNFQLSPELFEITDDTIDPKMATQYKSITLTEQGYILQPGRLYLGCTIEEIGSDHYVMSLVGRSSAARLGLFLQITADLGHQGTKHCWTLELKVVQPLVVYPKMIIGQVSFWEVDGDDQDLYDGKYVNYSSPHCSEIFKEF